MRETLRRFIAAVLAALPQGADDRGFVFARLVPPLAALVLIVGVAFAAAGYLFAHQADARLEAGQRIALGGAIETIRAQRGDVPDLGAADLRLLERNAGLADLKLETEPRTAGRSVQPLLSENGRITGWLSWQPQHPMTNLLLRWWPVAAMLLILLSALAWLSVWQLRRVLRVLEAAEKRAENFERNDTLIGLPHHRHLLELLGETLASRVSGQVVFFVHLDINRFAEVNETLGHAGGDETLVAFAMRLRELLPPGAICGRYGGDEFAVVMTGTDAGEMTAKIEGIVALLQRPYWVGGRAMKIETCAGFSQCPRDGTSRDALTRCADLALRAAKERGRVLVLSFDAAMDRENSDRRFIEKELRRALASETLDVHYQPIVAADGARMIGVEALLRWNHPERGAIAPLEFVAIAEQIGLMGELGHFVMRRALADARRWPELSIAINLSPLQVRDAALVGLVEKLLRVNAIAPARLLLEITEGVLIDEPEEAKARLDALRALGVRIALDDFGTGYSSLAYLQRFAFDKLKIDKSFVAPLGRSGNAGVLVQAMVALGRALGMTVLAEGVETEEQRVLLRLAGCDEMQGFLFGRPSPGKTIDRIVSPSVTAADRAIASRL